jgi:transcriptional regulator with PAS, ATPase and Fis domain
LLDKAEKVLGATMGDIRACASLGKPIRLEMPDGWPLKAELSARHPAEKGAVDPRGAIPGRTASRGPSAPASGRGKKPWRDTVIEAALQKAANFQKQKIPILITGESGVGKDYFVRRIHAEGIRKGGPLVLVNCAAIPRDLISSELFGYAPGSFTGARTGGKTGKFVEAHTGVLFLDEIGDMALDLQTALLCALDSPEIVPVGGSKPVLVDVQVIAATNNDLPDSVRKGSFRRDLYYRLNGAQFWLPPLRERPDKLEMIEHLWEQEIEAQHINGPKTLAGGVWDIFDRHPWPGNIRELRNVLRSCLVMASGREILPCDLPVDFLREMNNTNQEEEGDQVVSPLAQSQLPVERKALVEWETDAIRSALAKTSGNISESARQLGITRATLYHKMARLGLRR